MCGWSGGVVGERMMLQRCSVCSEASAALWHESARGERELRGGWGGVAEGVGVGVAYVRVEWRGGGGADDATALFRVQRGERSTVARICARRAGAERGLGGCCGGCGSGCGVCAGGVAGWWGSG